MSSPRFLSLLMVGLVLLAICPSQAASTIDPRQYGAAGDGRTKDTAAIQRAIDAVAAGGGGTVRLSGGTFLSGSLVLKSGVTLFIDKGATLLGSAQQADYLKNRWMAVVEAKGQHNIGVIGEGVIDGQGEALAADVLRLVQEKKIIDPLASNRPAEPNRPQLIEFVDCKNVTMQGITLKASACWVQTYMNCEHVSLDHVIVRSTAYWNNDGLDLVDCKHATVTHCDIDSADDGLCLKSGDAKRACEDIVVEDCAIRSSASAFKLGTNSKGAFRRIKVHQLRIHDTFRTAIAIESVDGAAIEGVDISDVQAKNTGGAIFIRLGNRNKEGGPGSVRDVQISNVSVEVPAGPPDAAYAHAGPAPKSPHNLLPSSIVGLPGHRISNVTLKNISVTTAGGGRRDVAEVPLGKLAAIPELADKYPEFSMFGELPAWAFYIRHAEGINFQNVSFQAANKDFRPAFVIDDAENIQLNRATIGPAGDSPIVVLNGVKGFNVTETTPPTGAKEFVRDLAK